MRKKKINNGILSCFFCKKKNPPCPVKLASASTEQKLHLGFYSTNKVGHAVICTIFFNVTDRFRQKKTTTREWEGMGVILPGVDGTGFSPSFFVGLGRDGINFCGSGTGEV